MAQNQRAKAASFPRRVSQYYIKPENMEVITAGRLLFGVEYRFLYHMDAKGEDTDLLKDRGISVHVFDGVPDEDHEVLRFDCLEIRPHYHYHLQASNEKVWLDVAAIGDPFQWVLERIGTRLAAMLLKGGAEGLARSLDQREIEAALSKLAAWGEFHRDRMWTGYKGPVHMVGGGRCAHLTGKNKE